MPLDETVPSPVLRALAACAVDAPPEDLARLSRDSDPRVRHAAVRHPALSPRAMLEAARFADAPTCEMLGENPALPVGVVRLLASHLADEVRLVAARHPRLDLTTLERLAEDRCALVRAVAEAALTRRLRGLATA
ncbi:hypothetical protein [Demequina iriomotensis]|uniref:hypothetical protein n=1 Tax=Demequina iriomotensis TaxID=1536641 RepID=UPI0012E0A382|nr:hypothetical protein [Demequina iriomotensis]